MKKSIRDAVEIESLELEGIGDVKKSLRVLHPHFGPGTVSAVIQFPPYSQTRNAIVVQFDSGQEKWLEPTYAKLQRLAEVPKKKSIWRFWK